MKIFSYDSKFIEFMNTLVDVVVLNFMWLLGCAPIITIGTSTIAAYSVTLKMVENRENHVARMYWKAFKENLPHGIALTIGFGLLAWSIWMDFQLFHAVSGNPVMFLIVGFLLGFIFILHVLYIFPLEARYSNTLIQAVKNAGRIAVRFYAKTLLMMVLVAVEIFLFYGVGEVLFVIGLLIGPTSVMMTVSGIVLPIFQALELEAQGNEGVDTGVSMEPAEDKPEL